MPRTHTNTWFFFGDSVTLGVNDTEVLGGWVSRLVMKAAGEGLVTLPPDTFYNLGCRRQKLCEIAARWKAEFMARQMPGIRSRIVFVSGTVDMLQGTDPELFGTQLSQLLDEAAQVPADILFLCPPPVADPAAAARGSVLMQKAAEVCSAHAVHCVNLYDRLLADGFASLITDGIHPGAQGNERLASLLIENATVRSFLSLPQD